MSSFAAASARISDAGGTNIQTTSASNSGENNAGVRLETPSWSIHEPSGKAVRASAGAGASAGLGSVSASARINVDPGTYAEAGATATVAIYQEYGGWIDVTDVSDTGFVSMNGNENFEAKRYQLSPGSGVSFSASAEESLGVPFSLGIKFEEGSSASVGFSVFEDSAQAIVSRWVSASPIQVNVLPGGHITARFEPKNINGHAVPLNLLARDLGFDHFNWYQEVVELVPLTRALGPDPLPGGNTPPFDVADEYEWYWDEVDASTALDDRRTYLASNNTYDSGLFFGDSVGLNVPFGYAEFTTYLVGVKDDPRHAVHFLSTAFKWRYDQGLFGGTVSTLQNLDPELAGGGTVEFLGFLQPNDYDEERLARLRNAGISIYSESVSAVPEPATNCLAVVGGIVLACCRLWRRTNSAAAHALGRHSQESMSD